ncbi:hypothetical protein [Nocardioides sp. GY 10127]|uniref:hypothetical protein n=1 Tax=Nocardioides sp. GY 10127 TaxID=2569762 RepID=UPI0010A8A98D|nr:hypothetical protein [Nocardioides sp. GY 10127]TIC85468.1 hypothetical protein E8D37_02185 [Nocardioides sp. GY 10127]
MTDPRTFEARDSAPSPAARVSDDLFAPVPGVSLSGVAVGSAMATGSHWRGLVTPRRLLSAAVAVPVLLVLFLAAVQGPATPGHQALVGVAALLGGLALATYVPDPRASAASTPCASLAGAWVLLAGFVLASPAEPTIGLLAVAAAGFGLLQRLRGGACAMVG